MCIYLIWNLACLLLQENCNLNLKQHWAQTKRFPAFWRFFSHTLTTSLPVILTNSDNFYCGRFLTISDNFWQLSEIVRNYQKLSEIVRNCQKLSDIIRNYQKLSEPDTVKIIRVYQDHRERRYQNTGKEMSDFPESDNFWQFFKITPKTLRNGCWTTRKCKRSRILKPQPLKPQP